MATCVNLYLYRIPGTYEGYDYRVWEYPLTFQNPPPFFGYTLMYPYKLGMNLPVGASTQDYQQVLADYDWWTAYCTTLALNQHESNVLNSINNAQNNINSNVTLSSGILYNQINQQANSINSTVANYSGALSTQLNGNRLDINAKVNASTAAIQSSIIGGIAQAVFNTNIESEYIRNVLNQSIAQSESRTQSAIEVVNNNVENNLNSVMSGIGDLAETVTTGLDFGLDGIIADIEDTVTYVIDVIKDVFLGILDVFKFLVYDQFKYMVEFLKNFESNSRNFAEDVTNLHDDLDTAYTLIRDKIESGHLNSWAELEGYFETIGGKTGFMKRAFVLLQLVPVIYKMSELYAYPFTSQLAILASEKARATLLPDNAILEGRKRDKITIETAIEELGLSGYADERIAILLQLSETLLDSDRIRQLFLRGDMNEETHDQRLTQLGYLPENVDQIKELYKLIPPVNDLILMAVREVFNPEISARFGLKEDFPVEFGEWTEKQGLTTDWAKNYWAAHWQLPSALQAFEMYHRRVIDRDDLELLMKALDYMPFWRDKMVAISFNPLTRVDVRRMHDVGVLNDSQVYDAYLDIGYSPENAQYMLDFTKRYNAKDEGTDANDIRLLSKSVIEKAYLQGLFDRGEAKDRLMQLDYSDKDATIILDMLDLNQQLDYTPDYTSSLMDKYSTMTIKSYAQRAISRADAIENLQTSGYGINEATATLDLADMESNLAFKTDVVNEIKSLYVERTIDQTDFRALLEGSGFGPEEIDMLLSKLGIFRDLRGRKPSRTDFKGFVKDDVIDLDGYIEELRGLGYPDQYIAMYIEREGLTEE